jgi:hypothetical protein
MTDCEIYHGYKANEPIRKSSFGLGFYICDDCKDVISNMIPEIIQDKCFNVFGKKCHMCNSMNVELVKLNISHYYCKNCLDDFTSFCIINRENFDKQCGICKCY